MNIGVVAHDGMKPTIIDWVKSNEAKFRQCQIFATGTTGKLLSEHCSQLSIHKLQSGPLGGDQQLGAMISEGRLSALIFFIDPLSPHPHDVDIKALIRLATLYDVPHACNSSTADLIATAIDQLPKPKKEPSININ